MESEFQILNNLEKNKNATQRELAKSTGMSLGNVNILIKRLVRKGMLKVERLTPKTIRYILTPDGLKEKAEMTYRYVVASYRFINDIQDKIEFVLSKQTEYNITEAVLFGSRDEICEMLEAKLRHRNITFEYVSMIDDIHRPDESTLFVWHPEYSEILLSRRIEHINLLDEL